MHAVNKKTKIQSTNHLNSSSHLFLILCMILTYIDSYSPTSILFCLFILQFVIKGKARQVPFVFLFLWNILCQAHITPKSPKPILFCLFIPQFVIKGKARQVPFVFLFLLLCWRIRNASPHNIRSSIWGLVTLLLCFSVHN